MRFREIGSPAAISWCGFPLIRLSPFRIPFARGRLVGLHLKVSSRCVTRANRQCGNDRALPHIGVAIARACFEAGNTELGTDEITAIIPCYLPNEQDIIEGSQDSADVLSSVQIHGSSRLSYRAAASMRNLEAPGELVLWLVYNTSEVQ
eukprot:3046077-Amphidinium_carterae.1